MLIKDIIDGLGVPFYSYNSSIKQQPYQRKLTLSSINTPPPPPTHIFWKYAGTCVVASQKIVLDVSARRGLYIR